MVLVVDSRVCRFCRNDIAILIDAIDILPVIRSADLFDHVMRTGWQIRNDDRFTCLALNDDRSLTRFQYRVRVLQPLRIQSHDIIVFRCRIFQDGAIGIAFS